MSAVEAEIAVRQAQLSGKPKPPDDGTDPFWVEEGA
jgi:hypothetical protein